MNLYIEEGVENTPDRLYSLINIFRRISERLGYSTEQLADALSYTVNELDAITDETNDNTISIHWSTSGSRINQNIQGE